VRRLEELMRVVLRGEKSNGKVEVGAEKLVGGLKEDCP
jgi:hypothetical protein